MSKQLLKIIFTLVLVFIFAVLAFQDDTLALDVLQGKISRIDTYTKSKLISYDPEASWQAVEHFNSANGPEISGTSGFVVDLTSDKITFDKDAHKKLPIASLTKIMTALVVLEHAELNKKLEISTLAASIGENAMGISAKEVYSIEELLYGLMLNSGNDSAYALAEGTAGDVNEFVKWMNLKAEELDLQDTHFTDPSGLDNGNVSSSYDLAKLTRYALKHKKFREVVKTTNKYLASNSHKDLFLENQTNLLTTYPGVFGVKTGYTEEAGLCLVTYAVNGGHEVVGVVLGSQDRKGDMIMMLDHTFSSLGIVVEHNLL